MAITPNTTFTAGAILTADQMNRLPFGILNYQQLTTDFTTTGTHTTFQDDGLSISVSFGANRLLRVSYHTHIFGAGGNNGGVIRLLQGATTLKEYFYSAVTVSNTAGLDVSPFIVIQTSSAGTATFKAQIRGTVNLAIASFASAIRPRQIMVEDIGRA